jgi:replication factor C large subunit
MITEKTNIKIQTSCYIFQMEDWTEKYRPKSLDNIIGNERAIAQLRRWAQQWNQGKPPKKRAIILSGKPGTGKTSSALAVAADFGWTSIELNASDVRNAEKIKLVATSGAVHETFDDHGQFISSKQGGRKLIILDEADNLYEKTEKTDKGENLSDKGGKKAIIDTIKITSQPMILIVNDYYSLIKGGGEPLKDVCTLIRFYPVYSHVIVDYLKRICREEGVVIDQRTLHVIADRCTGDVRSAVNDLQSICLDKQQVDAESLDVLGYRDREKIIFDVLRDIFKTRDLLSIHENVRNLDETPDTLLLWLNENLPQEYIAVDDLARGYAALSTADLFLGRVSKRQYYGMWSYACDIMQGGVATAKTHTYGNEKYHFPSWLTGMKTSRSMRGVRDLVMKKIGTLCHNSERKSNEFIFTQFRQLFRTDMEFACTMRKQLDLTEGEISYLLGEAYAHKLKEILEPCEKAEILPLETELPSSDDGGKKEPQRQQSLLDF